jgi:hypothetical protein
METHAQELHKATGQGLKHYIFEFFMLFLAVFCGFLAENFREHQVEHERGKQYVRSMIADLKMDTAEIRLVIDNNIKRILGMDSLTSLLNKSPLAIDDERQLYKLNSRHASSISTMLWNDGTIRQLLTSGNLRLISEQGISDSIMNYYGQPKDNILSQEGIVWESAKRIYFSAEDIFDRSYSRWNLNKDSSFSRQPLPDRVELLNKEKAILKKYSQMVITSRNLISNYLTMLFEMHHRAKSLLLFLQTKYDIK